VNRPDTTQAIITTAANARRALRDDLDAIIRSVHVIAFDECRSHPVFDPSASDPDRALINLARAVAQVSLPLAREFLSHDLPVECLEDLNRDIHELEAAVAQQRGVGSL
jgi:hypothetical protein